MCELIKLKINSMLLNTCDLQCVLQHITNWRNFVDTRNRECFQAPLPTLWLLLCTSTIILKYRKHVVAGYFINKFYNYMTASINIFCVTIHELIENELAILMFDDASSFLIM